MILLPFFFVFSALSGVSEARDLRQSSNSSLNVDRKKNKPVVTNEGKKILPSTLLKARNEQILKTQALSQSKASMKGNKTKKKKPSSKTKKKKPSFKTKKKKSSSKTKKKKPSSKTKVKTSFRTKKKKNSKTSSKEKKKLRNSSDKENSPNKKKSKTPRPSSIKAKRMGDPIMEGDFNDLVKYMEQLEANKSNSSRALTNAQNGVNDSPANQSNPSPALTNAQNGVNDSPPIRKAVSANNVNNMSTPIRKAVSANNVNNMSTEDSDREMSVKHREMVDILNSSPAGRVVRRRVKNNPVKDSLAVPDTNAQNGVNDSPPVRKAVSQTNVSLQNKFESPPIRKAVSANNVNNMSTPSEKDQNGGNPLFEKFAELNKGHLETMWENVKRVEKLFTALENRGDYHGKYLPWLMDHMRMDHMRTSDLPSYSGFLKYIFEKTKKKKSADKKENSADENLLNGEIPLTLRAHLTNRINAFRPILAELYREISPLKEVQDLLDEAKNWLKDDRVCDRSKVSREKFKGDVSEVVNGVCRDKNTPCIVELLYQLNWDIRTFKETRLCLDSEEMYEEIFEKSCSQLREELFKEDDVKCLNDIARDEKFKEWVLEQVRCEEDVKERIKILLRTKFDQKCKEGEHAVVFLDYRIGSEAFEKLTLFGLQHYHAFTKDFEDCNNLEPSDAERNTLRAFEKHLISLTICNPKNELEVDKLTRTFLQIEHRNGGLEVLYDELRKIKDVKSCVLVHSGDLMCEVTRTMKDQDETTRNINKHVVEWAVKKNDEFSSRVGKAWKAWKAKRNNNFDALSVLTPGGVPPPPPMPKNELDPTTTDGWIALPSADLHRGPQQKEFVGALVEVFKRKKILAKSNEGDVG